MYDISGFVVLDAARLLSNMINYGDVANPSAAVDMKKVDCWLEALGNAKEEKLAETVDR